MLGTYGKLYISHLSLGGAEAVAAIHSLCPDRIYDHNGSWNAEGDTYFGMVRPLDPQVDEALQGMGFVIHTPLGQGPLDEKEIAHLLQHSKRSRGTDEHHPKAGDHMHHVAMKMYRLHGNPHLKPTFY